MKKSLTLLVLAVFAVGMFAVSCASEPEPKPEPKPEPQKEEPKEPKEEKSSASNLPDFVMNPPSAQDALYGTGSSDMSDFGLARNAAAAEARGAIAAQINAQIKQAITSYSQESGTADETQTIKFAESITRQITSEEIQGARIAQVAQTDDGTVWVLVEYKKNALEGILEEKVENAKQEFARDEGAAFAEFKSNEALKQMEFETEGASGE